jgi:hypothetical protein
MVTFGEKNPKNDEQNRQSRFCYTKFFFTKSKHRDFLICLCVIDRLSKK